MSQPEAPEKAALGVDPFRAADGTLPYLIRLRERSIRLVGDDGKPKQRTPRPQKLERPDLGPAVPEVTSFDDAEEIGSWLDRAAGWLLDREEEERIHQVAVGLEADPYDALGLDTRTSRRTLALFKLLYRYYFRVDSSGHKVLPEKSGVILAANHGGLLPFDATMIVVDVLLKATPPRLVRAIVEHWAGTLPFVNVFYARVGQVIGTRANFRELLRRQNPVLVFPEGVRGIKKRAAERYVLQRFHLGFIEESLRHRVPIVPVALVGPDDQAPILYDIKPLARLLKLPVFPITPTFPLLGLPGLLPYPVRYEICYGEPFRFYEEYPVKAVDDPHAVRYMAEQVRRRIGEMLDHAVMKRRKRS